MSYLVPAEDPYLGIHAVDVYVRDQDAAVQFYVEQLGFMLAFDARLHSGQRWVAVAPPDGTTVLSLVAPAPDSKEYQLIGRPTEIVFVTEDVVATFERWRRRGVKFVFTPRLRRVRYERLGPQRPAGQPAIGPSQGPPVWGGIFTRFKDLDGNSFALIGFDEVNRHIEAQRRQAALRLEAERRAAQELEIAKQVQARLFPQRLPPPETLECAGVCVQARQVGGDYHDFLELGQGRFGLVIADISGKGMPAALLMANLQANLRSQCALAGCDPRGFLQSVNRLFYENTSESSYATLFYAEYDAGLRRLRYANCGHLAPMLLRRARAIERLESTCTVLGLFQDWDCEIAELPLCPGDTLVLYTDGVTEALNADEEEFGDERLVETLLRHRGLAPRQLVSAVVEELERFSSVEQYDDITLMAARCP